MQHLIRRVLLIALSALTIAVLSSCGSKNADTPKPQTQAATPSTETSQPAGAGIQFVANDVYGTPQNSDQWIGKRPVVLNFWGTWCPPCRREIPDLVKLYAEYQPKGVEIIGLAVKDEPSDVSAFSSEHGMKWVMLMANEQTLRDYDIVNGVPTTVFLDKDGKEITRFIGNRSYEDFKPAFDAILNGYSQPAQQ